MLTGAFFRGGTPIRAGEEGWSTWRAGGQTSCNCKNHNNQLNSLFQALHQEVVNPGEPEQDMGVPGGQGNRLQVIVHITFIIITPFLGFTSRGGAHKRAGTEGGRT